MAKKTGRDANQQGKKTIPPKDTEHSSSNPQNAALSAYEILLLLSGLALLFFGIYLAAGLVSHLFHWRSDASLIWQSLADPSNDGAANAMGTLATSLANFFMVKGIGVAALGFPVIALMVALRILRITTKPIVRTVAQILSGMVLFALIAAHLAAEANGFLIFGPGGRSGLYLSTLLNRIISPIGATLLILLLTTAYLVWIIPHFGVRLYRDWPKAIRKSINEHRAKRKEAKLRSAEEKKSKRTATPFNEVPTPNDEKTEYTETNDSQNILEEEPFNNTEDEPLSQNDSTHPEQANEDAASQQGTEPASQQVNRQNGTPLDSPTSSQDQTDKPHAEPAPQTQQAPTHRLSTPTFVTTTTAAPISPTSGSISDPEPPTSITGQEHHAPSSTPNESTDLPKLTEHQEENPTSPTSNPELESVTRNRTSNNGSDRDAFVRYNPLNDPPNYQFPKSDLLQEHGLSYDQVSDEELIRNKDRIIDTLLNYKITIERIRATVGPTVTLYEIIPSPGIRVSKIKNLEDDIALSLSALGIRIIAPMPGQGTIGIEVPNEIPSIVPMRDIVRSDPFRKADLQLPIGIGKTIANEVFIFDLAKAPHLLVAGATGQGKSVGLNAIITSLLYKKHPSELKFVLVDPKKVELTLYRTIQDHYIARLPNAEPAIVTDNEEVIDALNALCKEMDDRYLLLKEANVRHIKEYNDLIVKGKLKTKARSSGSIDKPALQHRFLPYIVVIIDEYADLIMTAGKDVELPLTRLAQLARAIGIHLVIATQRPMANIITGLIKANFPARIAFRVSSATDSRVILEAPGANQLIGRGDMLISLSSELVRVQCAFIDTPEIDAICKHIAQEPKPANPLILPESDDPQSGESKNAIRPNDVDDEFYDCVRFIVANQRCSTSSLQTNFSIGYAKAARIVSHMEAFGIVGPQPSNSQKTREVLIQDPEQMETLLRTIKEG